MKRGRKLYLKGFFSTLCCHRRDPPPPFVCILHPIPPYVQPLPPNSCFQYTFKPLVGIVPMMMRIIFITPPPPPSSLFADKEGSGGVSGQAEGFLSCNSYNVFAEYGIQFVELLKIIFMGKGYGVRFLNTMIRNTKKHNFPDDTNNDNLP